ncbi:hypothetical protein BDZ88DRAFT_109311 [Geranomyces variabilis]|nr:hypothetical protein BDZ88DRAFT_109311 [Geranomyces variabilis]
MSENLRPFLLPPAAPPFPHSFPHTIEILLLDSKDSLTLVSTSNRAVTYDQAFLSHLDKAFNETLSQSLRAAVIAKYGTYSGLVADSNLGKSFEAQVEGNTWILLVNRLQFTTYDADQICGRACRSPCFYLCPYRLSQQEVSRSRYWPQRRHRHADGIALCAYCHISAPSCACNGSPYQLGFRQPAQRRHFGAKERHQ